MFHSSKAIGNMLYHYLIPMCLAGTFAIIMTKEAVKKMTSTRTDMDEKVKHVDKIVYPSITVCKRYTYDNRGTTERMILKDTISLPQKKEAVREATWNRSQLFHFMNHPGMLNLTFPCTSQNGEDPVKPCLFASQDKPFNCESRKSQCLTRLYGNFTATRGDVKWGYCSENCNNVEPNPNSVYNLAKKDEVFTQEMFDFRTFEVGLCHTYNPPMI